MPNTKSAIRRMKRTRTQASLNRIRKSKYKSAVKQMSTYLESGKIKEAKSFLPKFHSQLMKVAKTGIISKKTTSRKISRITKKIKSLKNKLVN
jgi:small subunit ribosomal protein S20